MMFEILDFFLVFFCRFQRIKRAEIFPSIGSGVFFPGIDPVFT
jgi:hypothetical protein